ncbi:hypothetical protein [uncultured Mameliella sp.]|nr:hypothetical protein [uncultured Mameliella sp.]
MLLTCLLTGSCSLLFTPFVSFYYSDPLAVISEGAWVVLLHPLGVIASLYFFTAFFFRSARKKDAALGVASSTSVVLAWIAIGVVLAFIFWLSQQQFA